MIPLQALTPEDLAASVSGLTIADARKIVGAVHRHGGLPETIPMVRRECLEAVRSAGSIPLLTLVSTRASRLDPFVKYGLGTPDGLVIETVRIPLEREGRFSVCVSSQAGCGLGCSFCATGRMGLHRNLQAWEIVEQVRTVRCRLDLTSRQRVHGVVFQGMGEPLANIENVLQTIRVCCEPSALAVDGRNITVCTAGIPDGMERLAREAPRVRLGISIGSAQAEVRRVLMPIERVFPLKTVLEAAAGHARITGLAPMWAVTLLDGVNDSEDDARALASCARAFRERTGVRPQIRIVPYNPTSTPADEPFSRTDAERESAYCRILRAEGFIPHKRYSGGADVAAACGQLARFK